MSLVRGFQFKRTFDILTLLTDHFPPKPDMLALRGKEGWTYYSIDDYNRNSNSIARGLLAAGYKEGAKILSITPDRPEWNFLDMGTALAHMNELRYDFSCQYEEKDSIGRRYRRQDAIGTPFCITVDNQTPLDGTVTLRDRDTMEQVRMPVAELHDFIERKVTVNNLLRKL